MIFMFCKPPNMHPPFFARLVRSKRLPPPGPICSYHPLYMYMDIYIYIYICLCVSVCVHTHIYIYIYTYIYINTHIHTCTCFYTYIQMLTYTCIYESIYIYTTGCMCTHQKCRAWVCECYLDALPPLAPSFCPKVSPLSGRFALRRKKCTRLSPRCLESRDLASYPCTLHIM